MKNHNPENDIRTLNKKNDCKIIRRTIYILSIFSNFKINDLGNKSWGKIDFLVNYVDFKIMYVQDFKRMK